MSDDDRFEVADWQRATFTPHFGDPFDLAPYLAWPQRRPRKYRTDQGAPMSDWPTHTMSTAAASAAIDAMGGTADQMVKAGVKAALDAAPTASSTHWWCGAPRHARNEPRGLVRCKDPRGRAQCGDLTLEACPGPHHTLIIGPEAQP